ncbi:hypothetical protein [Flavobacterium sp.]|uniref:hypothetical protein n=1 Tax=Flavobacterium sp. TaxID=239 RepID=UPI0026078286|nr:hypothetical protein [Flavobacterium sp.]MDG2432834.1 hypothetical protein [Flavobacterium sp.]
MTEIEIVIDESAKDVELFKSLKTVSLNKTELFKYAIMMWEVPHHVVDSDFDYLQSKIPGLEMLLSDFIEFSDKSIKNLSNDDRVKKIVSEAVGVGVGLKYTVDLLETNPNKFKKIEPLTDGKYLDYSTIKDEKEYEIETKGTVQNYYTTFKNDILLKKEDSKRKKVHLRFGTIAMIKNEDDTNNSKCVIVDDPPENIQIENDDTFKTQLLTYATFLSYIIDTTYYNRYIRPLKANKFQKVRINENKFFGKYNYLGKEYYGECFDYRLVKENAENISKEQIKARDYFKILTDKVGKNKIFIGLDTEIIDAINEKNVEFLDNFNSDVSVVENKNQSIFLDKDGIIIIKSKNGSDKQLEKILTEEEVFRRLGLYSNYIRGESHKCGAPCRSREIEGKPCDIQTYRENCHFHR